MKKLISLCLALVLLVSLTAGMVPTVSAAYDMRVALVTDGWSGIDDGGMVQAIYEGAKEFCSDNGIPFSVVNAEDDYSDALIAAMEAAIGKGNNVLLLPGYVFAYPVTKIASKYPNVKFVALECTSSDFESYDDDGNLISSDVPANVAAITFRAEQSGFMAGYAAVRLGHRSLGFYGGMAIPEVVRYGYGFLQGADQAAKELGCTDQVSVRFAYSNQFFSDSSTETVVKSWYGAGVETIFVCGGALYTSIYSCPAKEGMFIGVDVDQSAEVNGEMGKNVTLTSAVKDFRMAAAYITGMIAFDGWSKFAGRETRLGVTNYNYFVGLPETTQWNKSFTRENYDEAMQKIANEEYIVSDSTEAVPNLQIKVIGDVPMGFTDVDPAEYYAKAVNWAVNNVITTGTSPTTFSPNDPCTRAQVVTFLWRANGCPAPSNKTNPFTDIAPGSYYYDAVLWAVEKGITTGTSSTKFSPDDACTRGQVVTFLYRCNRKPVVSNESNFNDVQSSAYYFAPVIWAVEHGITNGTGANRFSPDETCTRGQIVTFLYRASM